MPVRVCLFAKPPRPGEVKTRLAPAFGDDGAAALAAAFLRDTWAGLAQLEGFATVVATTGELPPQLGVPPHQTWLQGDGDLGARMERVLRRALEQESAYAAIAVGADTPGLPRRFLEEARARLADHDAVIGPTEDGGFYLIGLRSCPIGLFSQLPWSEPETYAATRARLAEHGMKVHELPSWFDVDRPEDVERLRRGIDSGEIDAPQTAAALRQLSRG